MIATPSRMTTPQINQIKLGEVLIAVPSLFTKDVPALEASQAVLEISIGLSGKEDQRSASPGHLDPEPLGPIRRRVAIRAQAIALSTACPRGVM